MDVEQSNEGLTTSTTDTTTTHSFTPELEDSLQLFFRLRPGTAAVTAAPNNGGWMIAAPT